MVLLLFVNKSSFFKNKFASSTSSWGEVVKLCEEEVERGEIGEQEVDPPF